MSRSEDRPPKIVRAAALDHTDCACSMMPASDPDAAAAAARTVTPVGLRQRPGRAKKPCLPSRDPAVAPKVCPSSLLNSKNAKMRPNLGLFLLAHGPPCHES